MTPKHTPGPWLFDPTDGTIWANGAEPITLFQQVDNGDMSDPEQLTADGNLVRAAPDMLEALEIFLSQRTYGSDYVGPYVPEWRIVKIARKAVAKARGEKP
jgi:hypothetical protein